MAVLLTSVPEAYKLKFCEAVRWFVWWALYSATSGSGGTVAHPHSRQWHSDLLLSTRRSCKLVTYPNPPIPSKVGRPLHNHNLSAMRFCQLNACTSYGLIESTNGQISSYSFLQLLCTNVHQRGEHCSWKARIIGKRCRLVGTQV